MLQRTAMPKVSLIVPVYNVSKYLRRCIASIASQTLRDFEVIFVNDGSTDDSERLCRELIAGYPYMRLVNKPNGGLSSARLYGFKESVGQYIVFVDSDDYLEPNYVETLYKAIIEKSADMSICSYFLDDNIQKKICPLSYDIGSSVIEHQDIFRKYILPQLPDVYGGSLFVPSFMWLRMFKRELVSEELFVSEHDVYQEDLVFAVRQFRSIRRIAVVNVPLYNYCINQGSLTLKYRAHVWQMMSNLYHEVWNNTKAFMCEELMFRLSGMVLCSLHFALCNASRLDFSSFKILLKDLIQETEVKETLHSLKWFKLKRAYIFMVLMITTRQSFILYKYYKSRV